tara:strand:- start:2460 stop:2714 length:255 start_codon:yes stop_codon:yes gene_type:complete
MHELKLIGNDIEMDGEKVARVFDIRASLRGDLELAIDRANINEGDSQDRIKVAFSAGYSKGRENGFEEGHQDGYEQRGREDQDM